MPCPSLVSFLDWKGCFGQPFVPQADKLGLHLWVKKGQSTVFRWNVYQDQFPPSTCRGSARSPCPPLPCQEQHLFANEGDSSNAVLLLEAPEEKRNILGHQRHLVKPTTITSVSDWPFILLFFLFLRLHTFPKHPKSQELGLKICWKYWESPSILLDEANIAFQVSKCIKLFNSNAALPMWCKAAAGVGTMHLHHAVELAVGYSNHCPYQCIPMWQNFHDLVLPPLSNRMGLRLFFFQYGNTTEMLCLEFYDIGSQLDNLLGSFSHPSYLSFLHQSLPTHRVAAVLCIAKTPFATITDFGI